MSRIFISYRASDGRKEASRLAVDLARHLGEAQVFFDKADLTAGTYWRQQVLAELGKKPVVALLLTPDYFGAVRDGQRRIDLPDDPVRLELLAALEAGATLVPLLTEGVSMPAADALPAALASLREHHALRLRTDDWEHDFGRLARDLERLGLKPRPPVPGPGPDDNPTATKAWRPLLGVAAAAWGLVELGAANATPLDSDTHIGAAVMLLLPLALAWITWRWTRAGSARAPRWLSMALVVLAGWSVLSHLVNGAQMANQGPQVAAGGASAPPPPTPQPQPQPVPQPQPAPVAALPTDGVSGTWVAHMANGQQLPMMLKLRDGRLQLQTQRIDIRQDPSMQPLVLLLAAQGVVLQDIRIRGEGDWDDREAELQMTLQSGDGQRRLNEGHMQLQQAPDGRSLSGSLQFAGGQPVPLVLRRP